MSSSGNSVVVVVAPAPSPPSSRVGSPGSPLKEGKRKEFTGWLDVINAHRVLAVGEKW